MIDGARRLRQEAAAQFASADKAMTMWAQWQRQEVTPEQDGSGNFSGAAVRARDHKASGLALCQSAALLHSILGRVPVAHAELKKEQATVSTSNCMPGADAASPDPTQRKAFRDKVAAEMDGAFKEENGLLDVCRRTLPNWSGADTNGLQYPLLFNE